MSLPRIIKSDRPEQTNIYRDFNMSFERHEISNDVNMSIDVKAVKESMRNILLTDKGSRVFNPYFGGDIRSLIFENKFNETLFKTVEQDVISVINTYEPRASLERVECRASMDDNVLEIIIYFYVINNENLQTTTVSMERIR